MSARRVALAAIYVVAWVLAASVAAVYAYVVLSLLLRWGIIAPQYAAGIAPALAG